MLTFFSALLAISHTGGGGTSTTGAGTSVNITTPGQLGEAANITVGSLVSFLINAILIIAGLAFFFMLIIGGLRWILSSGDKTNTEAARGQITAALVGLVIVFSAWAIATLVGTVFGIEIFNANFGTAFTSG